jgi:Leucine-rich repeat (LRR) protein
MAARSGSHVDKKKAKEATLPEDLRQLQAEILNGLESDEGEEEGASRQTADAPGNELTEAAVLTAAGEDSVEDVVQLVFRDRQLSSLTTPRSLDFDQLVNLEILSLSHNQLEDIEPLGMLVALIEVNLNFNCIVDLSPLYDCEHLEKLFASHNRVESIAGLEEGCPKLRELSLYANKLYDIEELKISLEGLPELQELHIGENSCCSAPSQKYGLIRALPSLRILDGQRLNSADKQFAAAFLEAAKRETVQDDVGVEDNRCLPPRPVTAPSAVSRPPLPKPHLASGLAPLPGQKLRSARANRIDDVLTQSREASPEVADCNRMPTLDLQSIDLSDPERTTSLLSVHIDALQSWLETIQIERDNLRFHVRLLEQDGASQQREQLTTDIEHLELENRNDGAVRSEHAQLQARIAAVETELKAVEATPVQRSALSSEKQGYSSGSDALSELRWENQLLEKRLNSMKQYSEQCRNSFTNTRQLTSSSKVISEAAVRAAPSDEITLDTELSRMLEENEAKLKKLQSDVSKSSVSDLPSQRVASTRQRQQEVDVLTLADDRRSEDIEWHGKN